MLRALADRLWGRSLRRQLVAGVALVHLVLMTIFVFDLVQRQRRFLLEAAERRVVAQAAMAARSSVHLVISNDLAGLGEVFESLATDPTVRYAFVVDPRGQVVAHTDAARSGRFLQDAASLAVLGGERAAHVVGRGRGLITAAAAIEVGDRPLGWVFVARDVTSDEAHLRYVTKSGLVYTVIAILAGTVLALALSRTVTRQLRLLLAGARRVAQSRLDEPVPVVTHNEVGEVSVEFNEMTRKLREYTEERERLLAELRLAVQARDEFLSIASHELKTPLTALDLQVSVALRSLHRAGDAATPMRDTEKRLQSVSRQVARLTSLVQNLLDVSRVTSGRMTLARGSCDLSDVVRVVVARTQALVAHARSELTTRLDGPVVGSWDRDKLEAVVENLLTNALKYGEGKPIDIALECTRDVARLVVRDRGIGISEEAQQRIFGRFERAVSLSHYGGFGLGLWIAREVVDAHGGRITVVSREGDGSTFSVELPRGALTDAAVPRAAEVARS